MPAENVVMLKVESKTARCGGLRMEIGGQVVFETLPGLERFGVSEMLALERLAAAILRAAGVDAYAAVDGRPPADEEALVD